MKTAKRAQVTWFILIGLIILGLFALVSWIIASSTVFSKDEQELVLAEDEMGTIRNYIMSCEKELAEEAIILIGNQGGKITPEEYFMIDESKIEISYDKEVRLPSVEEIAEDLAAYIDKHIVRRCNPRTVTKREFIAPEADTEILFSDKETVIATTWPVTVTFDNETEKKMSMMKIAIPVRMLKIHESILGELMVNYKTDLNYTESLDNMDVKKIDYGEAIVGIMIDHKSKIRDRPYKFFYAEKV